MANNLKNKKEIWKDAFKSSCLRVGFKLGLSRPMCEFLSAVADGVQWNRSSLGPASPEPDNFIAVGRALCSRGLIVRKATLTPKDDYRWSVYDLTPAGALVVELLKLAGVFVKADAAIK